MRKPGEDIPYVTDREAWAIARALEGQGYKDIARRIKIAVWKRRAVMGLSGLLVLVGAILIFGSIVVIGG